MISRLIILELEKWATQPNRKPLVLRGARQVGKTYVVNQFSSNFEQYIYLNLELAEDRLPFEQFINIDTSCFPHFLKTSSASPDFIGMVFEIGCCNAIFVHVFKKIKESLWQYFSSNNLKVKWQVPCL